MHATLFTTQRLLSAVRGGIQSVEEKLRCTGLQCVVIIIACFLAVLPLATPARTAIMVSFHSRKENKQELLSAGFFFVSFCSGVTREDASPLAGTDETVWEMHGDVSVSASSPWTCLTSRRRGAGGTRRGVQVEFLPTHGRTNGEHRKHLFTFRRQDVR